MRIGTKSLLYGVHQFLIHPAYVLLAWRIVYRKAPRLHELVAIIIHDWGYWGCPNMDGTWGERHPRIAAKGFINATKRYRRSNIFWLFVGSVVYGKRWQIYSEIMGHSRFNAKAFGIPLSKLFRADKMATAIYPRWLYLLLGNLTGEIHDYMEHGALKGGKYADIPKAAQTQTQWLIETQAHMALMGLHGENYGPVAKQLKIK